jgi:hypothetical protein
MDNKDISIDLFVEEIPALEGLEVELLPDGTLALSPATAFTAASTVGGSSASSVSTFSC